MSWILGNTDRLMDARFAAAAGAERLVLQMDAADPGAWNEISGWVAGLDLWLLATPALAAVGPGFNEHFLECKGIFCRDLVVWDAMEGLFDGPAMQDLGWAFELSPDVLGRIRSRGGWGPRRPDWMVMDPWAVEPDDTALIKTGSGPNMPWFALVPVNQEADEGSVQRLSQRLDILAEKTGSACAGLYFQATPGQDADYVRVEDWVQALEDRFL